MWIEVWHVSMVAIIGILTTVTSSTAQTLEVNPLPETKSDFTQSQVINDDELQDSEANLGTKQIEKREVASENANKLSENSIRIDNEHEANNDWSDNMAESKRFFTWPRIRATKSEGYKRGPGFRSWGGKRGNKFSSWGGKRSEEISTEEPEKGEREFSMPFEQFQKRTNSIYGGKRRPFQSWGGKRNYFKNSLGQPIFLRADDLRKLLSWEGKRKFSSWGGKRSEADLEVDKRKKPSFSSWGGKRADNDLGNDELQSEEDVFVFQQ